MRKDSQKFVLSLTLALLMPVFALSQISLWGFDVNAQTTNTDAVDETKDSIKDLQAQIEKEQKAQAKLQQNLGQIQQAVSGTQYVINKSKSAIAEADKSISKKEAEIQNLNDKIELQKKMLASFLQQAYYIQNQRILGIVLTDSDFSQIFSTKDHLMTLEDKIMDMSSEIAETKSQIEEDKAQLAETKEQHLDIIDEKTDQKQSLLANQADVQSDIQDKQQIIDKLNKEISQLQGDLNKLLGKSYNASDIKEAVKYASDSTGVPKGFLFGMLKMETNLGANVGGCTYAQVEDGAEASYRAGRLSKRAWTTFLNRREIFKKITNELDLDYRKQKVSCNPRGYVGTGGAMGVAQFMPDTWMGYKSQVTTKTGHKPPSPWNLTDGVMAMALKLSRTPGVTDGKTSAMKSAACSYLGTCYAPYINGILYWAEHYKELL